MPGPTLFHMMLRVKDPEKTLAFYKKLGFSLVDVKKFSSFALYFVATVEDGIELPEPGTTESNMFLFENPHKLAFLEFTHNFGTEEAEGAVYHAGNGDVDGRPQGYGHVAIQVDDMNAFCAGLEKSGVLFKKKPDEGRMKGLAFIVDPDGYSIEILPRHAL